MRVDRAALILVASCFVVGCDQIAALAQDRYQIVSTPDGRTLRLDKKEGDVFLIEKNVITRIPEDSKLSLSVGRIYKLEDERLMKYLGDGKFDSAEKVINWKHLPDKKLEFEPAEKVINWKDLPDK